jgi:RNA polymerase sigma factor (sigma-70 family)
MNDDLTLLREFVQKHSETAFAALVERHLNLVYSVALRQGNTAHQAEEITQAVFILLARKAATLDENIILAGWLCRTARFVGANARTVRHRRQQREQEAFMQFNASESTAVVWEQLAPLLDDAMAQLNQKEHDALVLRFFENKNFAEVAAHTGVSEAAAKKRVYRALEKLQKILSRRGIRSTTTILSGAISAQAVQAAPAGLDKIISTVAVSKGSLATATTMTLVKGTLKMMLWNSIKRIAAVSMTAALVAGTATYIFGAGGQPETAVVRAPAAALTPLDLTTNYTTPAWYLPKITRFPGWKTVPVGTQNFHNIPLQIDGMFCLWGEGNATKFKMDFPEEITGIKANRKFDSLYVYHGSFFRSPRGTPVCRIVFRYADGSSATNQMFYGEDILDWMTEQPLEAPSAARSRIAWIGGSSSTNSVRPLRFCLTEIINPQPALEVESIDFYSAKGRTAACIMAMTAGKAGQMK